MPDSLGDAAQIRKIGEQIAEATIIKMREVERPKMEIPAPYKWGAGIIAAVLRDHQQRGRAQGGGGAAPVRHSRSRN